MSEAVRLAAILEDEKMHSMAIDTEAAAELRRLHALNAELVEALTMVRDADNDCHKDGLQAIPSPARAKIDAALAKATKQGESK